MSVVQQRRAHLERLVAQYGAPTSEIDIRTEQGDDQWAILTLQELPDPMVDRLHLEPVDPSMPDWNFAAMAKADVDAGHLNILTGGFTAYWDVMDVYYWRYGTAVLYWQGCRGSRRAFSLMEKYNAVSEQAIARKWGDDHLKRAHTVADQWAAAKAVRLRGRLVATLQSPVGARVFVSPDADFNGDGKADATDQAALRDALNGAAFVEAIDALTDLVILADSGDPPPKPDDPLDPVEQNRYQRVQRAFEAVNIRRAEQSDLAEQHKVDVTDVDFVRETLRP